MSLHSPISSSTHGLPPTPTSFEVEKSSIDPSTILPLQFHTGIKSHVWGNLSELEDYKHLPDGPEWIPRLSTYAYGKGTVKLLLITKDLGQPFLQVVLQDVLYVPELLTQEGEATRLFSLPAAQDSFPELSMSFSSRNGSYLAFPNGLRVPLRVSQGLYYLETLPASCPTLALDNQVPTPIQPQRQSPTAYVDVSAKAKWSPTATIASLPPVSTATCCTGSPIGRSSPYTTLREKFAPGSKKKSSSSFNCSTKVVHAEDGRFFPRKPIPDPDNCPLDYTAFLAPR